MRGATRVSAGARAALSRRTWPLKSWLWCSRGAAFECACAIIAFARAGFPRRVSSLSGSRSRCKSADRRSVKVGSAAQGIGARSQRCHCECRWRSRSAPVSRFFSGRRKAVIPTANRDSENAANPPVKRTVAVKMTLRCACPSPPWDDGKRVGRPVDLPGAAGGIRSHASNPGASSGSFSRHPQAEWFERNGWVRK
jgi:hypothetical protein